MRDVWELLEMTAAVVIAAVIVALLFVSLPFRLMASIAKWVNENYRPK